MKEIETETEVGGGEKRGVNAMMVSVLGGRRGRSDVIVQLCSRMGGFRWVMKFPIDSARLPISEEGGKGEGGRAQGQRKGGNQSQPRR